VFGILFLDWSGGKVLLVYFADTLGSMYAVSTLAAYAAAQTEPEFQAWIKDGITPLKRLRIVVGTALIGFLGPVVVAIPFGGFLAILLTIQDFAWSEAWADRSPWISIGCQFAGTVMLMLGQLHWIATLKDPGKLVQARTGLLFARWVAMLLVGVRTSASHRYDRVRSSMAITLRPGKDELKSIAREVMLKRGLLPNFSPAVIAETNRITQAAAASGAAIRDLRGLLWASIDNDDSADLDQLSVAEAVAGGAVKILVAIADVDALVKKDSAIDGHAWTNTTSVYTAAGIFPMLPEKLSTDLTSLGEGQERLAIVIEMVISTDGAVVASDIYRAAVLNRAKLAYNGVAAWLEGTAPAPPKLAAVPGLDEQLRVQDRTAQALKKVRHAHGALQLETLQVRAVFDSGALADLLPDEKNRAKELIEDFMIAANGVTAKYLAEKGVPSLRRVLRTPERWDRIVALACASGERLPPTPDAAALDAFLSKRRQLDPARFADVSLSVIKLLGSGEYALDVPGQPSEGHFALAVKDYTHSTAPNRRFPDLVTQRLLKAALTGQTSQYTNDELTTLARHCTDQEDNAAKVERQVGKSAAALLLASRIGARFDAIVTGASDKGTWVRISGPTAEGRVVRGFEGLDVGDRVVVELVRADVARGFIDFAAVRPKP
jgi:VacB/RNase II family 3'-5' exoribonuclease